MIFGCAGEGPLMVLIKLAESVDLREICPDNYPLVAIYFYLVDQSCVNLWTSGACLLQKGRARLAIPEMTE